MIAAGFPFQTLSPYGREPTSKAFFNTAGIERLYSGVTNKTASSSLILCLNSVTSAGVPKSPSQS